MKNPTQKEIDTAIKECRWRKDLAGANVCTGRVLPCAVVIEKGKCDTLRELFNVEAHEESEG